MFTNINFHQYISHYNNTTYDELLNFLYFKNILFNSSKKIHFKNSITIKECIKRERNLFDYKMIETMIIDCHLLILISIIIFHFTLQSSHITSSLFIHLYKIFSIKSTCPHTFKKLKFKKRILSIDNWRPH